MNCGLYHQLHDNIFTIRTLWITSKTDSRGRGSHGVPAHVAHTRKARARNPQPAAGNHRIIERTVLFVIYLPSMIIV